MGQYIQFIFHSPMEGSSLPYFRGVPRQKGRGLGALAGTVIRTAFPIIKKFVIPAAKKIGRDVIGAAVPEIGEVVSGRQSVKRALKRTANTAIRNQIGGGRAKRKRTYKKTLRSKRTSRKRAKKKTTISKKKRVQRSRDDFFSKVKE